ncbi:hypothetical protein ANO11243_044920 [Dothideomycetidae sp. 11243]|nr:hypothetical protein ANO11243_044920 [fungal sp. No.11243]
MSKWHPFGGRISRHFGDSSSSLAPPDAYLSYYDVRLTKEDVDSLKSDWLTDNVIAFWEEYLEHEKLPHFPRANIVLLRPSMAFMLLNASDPRDLASALPSFSGTTHIFLPVNDCHDPNRAEGGTHWSLLVVSVLDGVAFHYDSMGASNRSDAAALARHFAALLGRELRFVHLEDSPQQQNGSDCGVFVCLIMQHLLLGRLLTSGPGGKVNMSMEGKEVDASGGRKEIMRLIEAFRKEGERRRSSSMGRSRSRGKATPSRSPPRIGEENDPA